MENGHHDNNTEPNEPECSPEPMSVPDEPPERERLARPSRWVNLFDEARAARGTWRRTVATFSKSTASQVASDIRMAHRRDPAKMRIRGLHRYERWEAICGPSPHGPAGRYCIWLRYLGPSSN